MSDIRHNFNTYLVLKSKFPLHGIGGYLVNNWELAPLVRVVNGTPFTVIQNVDQSFTGNGKNRPNLVPGVLIYNRTKIYSRYGKDSNLRRPDAQISRIFPIRERVNLLLRLEAYNVLNHPSFTGGNNGANVSNAVVTFNLPGSNFGELTSSNAVRIFHLLQSADLAGDARNIPRNTCTFWLDCDGDPNRICSGISLHRSTRRYSRTPAANNATLWRVGVI